MPRWLRSFLLWLASFAVGTVIFVVSMYLVASLVVTYLKLTGSAIEGERMFHDFRTPSWTGLLLYQGASLAILGVGFFLRAKLARLAPRQATVAEEDWRG